MGAGDGTERLRVGRPGGNLLPRPHRGTLERCVSATTSRSAKRYRPECDDWGPTRRSPLEQVTHLLGDHAGNSRGCQPGEPVERPGVLSYAHPRLPLLDGFDDLSSGLVGGGGLRRRASSGSVTEVDSGVLRYVCPDGAWEDGSDRQCGFV